MPRLRLTFYIIAGVLIAQMFIGIGQMQNLKSAVTDLTEKAVGTLLLTEASERDLKNLLLLLQRANTVASAEALPEIEAQLDQALLDLRKTINSMARTGLTDEKSQQMAEALNEIETGVSIVLAAQTATAQHGQNLTSLSQDLIDIHAKARSALENLSFEALQQTDETFEKYVTQRDASASQLYAEISTNLAHANTLTSLTLQLDATFDKASSLLTLTDPKVIDINQYALRADLRGLVILMSQMPDSDTRLQLARVVRDTRNLLFSPEKIVSEVTAKAAKQTNLNTLLTGQNEPIALISALSAQLNDGAKS